MVIRKNILDGVNFRKREENRGYRISKPSIQRSSFLIRSQVQNDIVIGKHPLEGVNF